MDELYELKELLCKKLEEYAKKGELTANSLEVIDRLSHAAKNVGKLIEMYEDEDGGYSEEGRGGSYRYSYARGGNRYSRESGGGNRGGGQSYARGRGRNARRDSMGRYSSEGGYSRTSDIEELVDNLRDMMQDLPEETKREAQRFMMKLEEQM